MFSGRDAFERLEPRRLLSSTTTSTATTALPRSEWAGAIEAAIHQVAGWRELIGSQLSSTRDWVVALQPGADASRFARAVRAASVQESGLLEDVYLVRFDDSLSGKGIDRRLSENALIDFYYPLYERIGQTRAIPNDPLFGNQWHLRNTGQSGGTVNADANVAPAWDTVQGSGVIIGIVDDGMASTHPDLNPNFSAANSYDFVTSTPGVSVNGGGHGTSVAGVAAARWNNSIGVSGASPLSQLAGLRLLGTGQNDQREANALTYNNQAVAVYNNSWGPSDGGTILQGPGPLAAAALVNGANSGRGGLGSIFVWAGGNGGTTDNVNYDGYANARQVIAVGAITNTGVRSSYSERGSALLVSAYSNGGTLGIQTTSGTSGYTSSFGGTSSASPLAAGVIGLMLSANPNLSWRDVQHVLVRTARRNDAAQADWFVNGGGHDFNHNYGHGAVDAVPAVNLSKLWGGLAPETSVNSGTINVGVPLPASTATFTTNTFNIPQNIRIENVEVVLNATRVSELALVSPSGTRSILANRGGTSSTTYSNWLSSSTAHWDEFSQGNWRLEVNNKSATAGTFTSWQLRIYGTPIDSAAPTLASNFEFETQQRLVLDFNENVAPSLTASDLVIQNLTTSQTIPTANISLQWDHATNNAYVTFLNQPGGILPDGNYRVTIAAGTVTDIWNNPMGAHQYDFFVKAGDATRDGAVNGLDFNILAANFGQSPRTFSQGDFNYDGVVNGLDFNILAGAFGTSLPPSLGRPAAAPPAEGPGGGMMRWGSGSTGSTPGSTSSRDRASLPFSDTPVKGLFDLPGDAPMEGLL